VTALVIAGVTIALDQNVLALFQGQDPASALAGPAWLQEAGRDVTAMGSVSVLVLAVIATCLYLWSAGKARLSLLMLLSALSATIFSSVLKHLIDRARPPIQHQGMQTFTASFPSGHSLMSAAIILSIGGLLAAAAPRRAERIVIMSCATLLMILVGLSRLYLGVHWPSDVLAGWLFGTAWACLTLSLAYRQEAT
jgi:undecaprenyl-diphosphatase